MISLGIGGLLGAGLALMVATLFGEGRLSGKLDLIPLAALGAAASCALSCAVAYAISKFRVEAHAKRARGKRPQSGRLKNGLPMTQNLQG